VCVCVCVCVYVCMCVCACVCACVRVCARVSHVPSEWFMSRRSIFLHVLKPWCNTTCARCLSGVYDIYMYRHTYICVYAHICTHTHTYSGVSVSVSASALGIRMYMHTCIHTYMCVYIPIYTYVYIHVCRHTHIFVKTYIYMYVYIYMYIHTYICVYTYACAHKNDCVYMYLWVATTFARCWFGVSFSVSARVCQELWMRQSANDLEWSTVGLLMCTRYLSGSLPASCVCDIVDGMCVWGGRGRRGGTYKWVHVRVGCCQGPRSCHTYEWLYTCVTHMNAYTPELCVCDGIKVTHMNEYTHLCHACVM